MAARRGQFDTSRNAEFIRRRATIALHDAKDGKLLWRKEDFKGVFPRFFTSALLALSPASELIVFQPDENAYTEVARIKVASSPTYAYPVVSGKRIFVKNKDDVTLSMVE